MLDKSKKRQKLWNENEGKCHWCGIFTKLPTPGINNENKDDMATIDHLRTRLDENRLEPNVSSEKRLVLSCFSCNNVRGVLNQKCTQNIKIKIKQTDIFYR